MEYLVVFIAAFLASALTLFSGFGLGTLLMPVIALFFSVELAIAITALVHLANNLFKFALLGKMADRAVLLRFGLPAVATAFLGALMLIWLADMPALFSYRVFGETLQVSLVKFVVGLLILVFVMLELWSGLSRMALARKYLPLGGMISGFFGGLSGHQGALRSLFLIKSGLDKQAFIATGVVLAVMVDMSRLLVYGWDLAGQARHIAWPLVISASASAFLGAWLGTRLLRKITFRFVQMVVSALLALIAVGLTSGVL